MSKIKRLLGVPAAAAMLLLAFAGAANATTGTATWYDDSGYGACGTSIDAATQMLVAVPASLWTASNPNDDPLCSESVQVTYNGTTLTLPIEDKCAGCGASQIDLSEPAFEQFADPSVGVISVSWQIVSNSGGTSGGTSCSSATTWVAGQNYDVGAIVQYPANGQYYIATHANPGYDPTISTWYWSSYTCPTSG